MQQELGGNNQKPMGFVYYFSNYCAYDTLGAFFVI